MRVFCTLALAALVASCTPKNKADAPDAAANDDVDPNVRAVSVTVDDRPFPLGSAIALQTARAGARDPATGAPLAIMTVTLETATHETLLFDIPWKDGSLGDRDDARLSYATGGGTYRSGNAHVDVKRVQQVDPQTYACDVEFEIPVTKVMGSETVVVKGTFTALKVKALPKQLQRL